jgi:hypothetical protein
MTDCNALHDHPPHGTCPGLGPLMAECDGMCVTAGDIGLGPAEGVDYRDIAYPHPGCPLHAPEQVCGCGQPDRCMSPTHGQITLPEALAARYSQNPTDPRARS